MANVAPGRVEKCRSPTTEKCRPHQIYNLNLQLTSGSFVKDHLLFLLFTKNGGITPPPPFSGPCLQAWKK